MVWYYVVIYGIVWYYGIVMVISWLWGQIHLGCCQTHRPRTVKATTSQNPALYQKCWTKHELFIHWSGLSSAVGINLCMTDLFSQHSCGYETTRAVLLKSIQGWVMGQDHHLHSCLLHKLAPERGGRRMARLVKVIEVMWLHWFSLHLHKLLVPSGTARASVWTQG